MYGPYSMVEIVLNRLPSAKALTMSYESYNMDAILRRAFSQFSSFDHALVTYFNDFEFYPVWYKS